MTFNFPAREWLCENTGIAPPSLEITRLEGATSSSVFRVHERRDPRAESFVLRVIDNAAWLAEEPDLAEHEAAALQEAQKAGLPAPRLVAHATDTANELGFGAPIVLMSFLGGSIQLRPPDFSSWLRGLATDLAVIHRHSAESFPWRYRSWRTDHRALAPPLWSARPRVWEQAIERAHQPAPRFRPVFLHRDYHPTNVLWHGESISGVVDWINACRGPAGVDVAHCRTNLAQMFGGEAADRFLDAYREIVPTFEYDWYWDLDSMLDVCLPEPTFYPPWQTFGLAILAPELLRERAETYLESVLRRG
ncbi:MAG: aminoglycoside phosphotransferase family protein [Cytophagales bacterium]|nr:aminoglycoside phosphotransferase family protein [Armatimonadota bacterium]